MFRQFGAQELLIILLIVVLLFGAKKLPDTARGLGRSLRIFKAETKGLTEDEKPSDSDAAPQITSQSSSDHQPAAASDPASRPAAESTHSDERS